MFSVIGCSDEVTTCEKCGKAGLKKTVVLESDATGQVHYGVDCAAAALYGSKSSAHRTRADKVSRAFVFARHNLELRPERAVEPKYLNIIAGQIRVRYCDAHVIGGEIVIDGHKLESVSQC